MATTSRSGSKSQVIFEKHGRNGRCVEREGDTLCDLTSPSRMILLFQSRNIAGNS
jgi:hypothetical protein